MSEDSEDNPLLDGKYRVVRQLGAGGFGQVLLAVDEVLGARQVAIKVLREPDIDESVLLAEMRTLAALESPGVVTFYHPFVQFRKLHLVMEYCPGGSLRTVLARGPLPIDRAIQAVRDVAATLQIVHAHEIVHHDIKPENLLYAADGSLKVGDFGVANLNAGTPVYMAPELFLGATGSRQDPRIDVYALGVTLLELVTGGDVLLRGKSADELLRLKLKQEFIPTAIPEWLQEVLFRATHPTPELRFQSMQNVAEALESRYVPSYVFLHPNRLRAQAVAEEAERLLAKKKWKQAELRIRQAFSLSEDCVAAHIAAGRLALMLKRMSDASQHFAEALRLNLRTHIQKDLGWIAAEQGDYAKAISLLNDHLLRHANDFEAYNLLLYCFYMTGRYEAGENLARTVMNEKPPSDCFRNNRFLCRVLGGMAEKELAETRVKEIVNPFVHYNYLVATESPASWNADGQVRLKSKLVFQDYRLGLREAGLANNIVTIRADGVKSKFDSPIVSLGSLESNDVVLSAKSVSRRHCVLMNYASDVWLVDLDSTAGTTIDGERLKGRRHLAGVHVVRLGKAELTVSSREGLLV